MGRLITEKTEEEMMIEEERKDKEGMRTESHTMLFKVHVSVFLVLSDELVRSRDLFSHSFLSYQNLDIDC